MVQKNLLGDYLPMETKPHMLLVLSPEEVIPIGDILPPPFNQP